MFGIGSDTFTLPWRPELKAVWERIKPLVQDDNPARSIKHCLIAALLTMSAQGEFEPGPRQVKEAVLLVYSNYAPLQPSRAPHLGIPDQRRWTDFNWDQWCLLAPLLVRLLESGRPMSVFDIP